MTTLSQFLRACRSAAPCSPAAEQEGRQDRGRSSGEVDIIVAPTRSRATSIPKLKFAVIDEQYRFGVRQRTTLRQKSALSTCWSDRDPIP